MQRGTAARLSPLICRREVGVAEAARCGGLGRRPGLDPVPRGQRMPLCA